ncbi:hypothetical protein AtNW77_Chr5g0130211 [Arabidopsis thaliana]|uniref:MADS-box domain-containing protein n=2 Tax=Arabidopsis TaxID=3701 RepID=A0A178UNB0_ARATH|nr:hypothetical protein ISN45_At05g041410 [Arabidopsis thaliana x Arabidopsis arenosa]OAO94960.1 hypothetical protein AXX17_AT5G44780 [Arabidopsis thaliana]VYS69476.1 unnamed protein product [Arabidopsis thaliana]
MVRHFRKTDTLARLCSIDVGVLIIPSTDVSARRVRSSTRQTRILKNQAKLDSLMAELEQIKAYEKVLRKGQEQNIKKYNRKEISDLKLEDLVIFQKKLENLQDDLKKKRVELEASLSL